MPLRFRHRIENIDNTVDSVLATKVLPVVETFKKEDKIDMGKGIIMPSKDVVKMLQMLATTRPSILDLIVKILSICSFALSIIILVKVST